MNEKVRGTLECLFENTIRMLLAAGVSLARSREMATRALERALANIEAEEAERLEVERVLSDLEREG